MSTVDPWLQRVLSTIGLMILSIALLSSLWFLIDVWLLLFAALLMAVFLNALTHHVKRWTGFGHFLALGIVLLSLIVGVVGLGALAGPSLIEQIKQLSQALPQALEKAQHNLSRIPYIADWFERIFYDQAEVERMVQQAVGYLPNVAGLFVSAITTFLIILIVGSYLAAQPALYQRSLTRLIPINSRPKVEHVLHATGNALEKWLTGQFILMCFVGGCTTLGLLLMQIPFALALGFLAFLLNFIPVIGPIIAAVPALLIVLVFKPDFIWYVLALYVVVQQVESYGLAPFVQNRLISLPPVVLLLSQVIMGSLTGFFGVAMATPLAITVIIWVQVLYVKGLLGDHDIVVLGTRAEPKPALAAETDVTDIQTDALNEPKPPKDQSS